MEKLESLQIVFFFATFKIFLSICDWLRLLLIGFVGVMVNDVVDIEYELVFWTSLNLVQEISQT